MNADALPDRSFRVRRVAILGNVSVGKTSLFDQLCDSGEHAVNIPGSTLQVSRGVLAVGAGAAPRSLRSRCAACGRHPGRARRFAPCASSPDATCPPAGSGLLARWIPGRVAGLALRSSEPLDRSHLTAASVAGTITHLFDTPGSSMLGAGSEDEMVARDLLLSGHMDAVLLVADSKNVRRALAFALQVAEFRLPMVVALNMIDEAESIGLELDSVELTRSLGVPVGRTVAVEGTGVRRVAELLLDAQVPRVAVKFPEVIEDGLVRLEQMVANPVIHPRALGLLLLSGDKAADDWVGAHLGESVRGQAREVVDKVRTRFATPLAALVVDAYHSAATRLADRIVTSSPRGATFLTKFGEMALRPFSGTLIAAAVLVVSYLWVGSFGASYLVGLLSAKLFDELLIPLTARVIAPITSTFLRDAILDPNFGLLPTGLALAVGTVLPVLFCFYLLQAVLEDSGYLPRLAVLSDRLLRGIGLNGQGLIPLVLGFSCTTMAMITARILPSRRERIILTLLLIGVPCAPLIAVMLVVLGRMSWIAGAVVL
ncbi:MAG: 50S ribosome-binding GTPase, partial [Polyangiaceae bacterium]|nr:50S ribosome-binding GTPase [Polyangiaceae bacterium]